MLTRDLMAKLPTGIDLRDLAHQVHDFEDWDNVLVWNLTLAALLWFASDLADARWIKANL